MIIKFVSSSVTNHHYLVISIFGLYLLGMQIPQDVLAIESLKSKAKYVLILEKNATFQKVIDEGLLKKNEFVIITVSYDR